MVRYNIDKIDESMCLGESIFLPTGELLLAAGYQIKSQYRQRLIQMGYETVMVEVEGTEDVRPTSVISEETQREAQNAVNATSKELQDAFSEFKKQNLSNVKEIIKGNRTYLQKFIMHSGMLIALERILDEIISQTSIVLNLSAMQQTHSALLAHALAVTVTSLCIGKKYKFSYEELKQLAIGAIHYDMGLIALPKEILEKQNRTDEEEELVRQHTMFGYYMLSDNFAIPPTSAAVALQHHENQDGSGYPYGLQGENRPPLKDFSRSNVIHRFAEIVAVADVYDTLLGSRGKPNKILTTRDAIKEIIQLGGRTLNADIVKAFVSMVPLYPVGARIRIVDGPTSQLIGYFGVVAQDNPSNLENPQIILYETKNHQKIKPILIDLSKHSGFSIELII